MPCGECGSDDLLERRRPAPRSASASARTPRARRARCPRPTAPAARRSACRRGSRRSAASISSGNSSEVESQCVAPDHVAEQQRGVGHVAGERAALVERGGEGDHPVARDRAVGGLEARRSRTATPAGGSSRRCRCRSPTVRGRPRRPRPSRRSSRRGPAPGPTGSARGRSPSSRSTSPSRTRPCSSCRAPSRPPPGACAPRWPCRAAGSPRGCASRRCWARPRRRRGP